MSALKKTSAVDDNPVVAAAESGAASAVAEEAAHGIGPKLKNIALFFVAPFVGLAYFLALPVVGFVMAARNGSKALKKRYGAK